jgi:hypothetical protein
MTCASERFLLEREFSESKMATVSQSVVEERASELSRWTQLIVGIICMVMIANLQYGWTLFTIPIKDKFG